MKTSIIIIALSLAGIAGLAAQTANPAPAGAAQGTPLPAPTAWQMAKHDANSRVWQRTVYERGPGGKVMPHIHQYTELASGMYYKDAGGQWQESKDEIDAYAQGAISQKGQYQVIYANNINSAGSIDLQAPDGKRLRSNILGLVYHDTASGDDVLIGQVQDSTGQLISANQVLYTNAFSGVNADVRYTYKKGSFEQDVILREQPPTPELVGLNSATTLLEVMTEFLNPPQETIRQEQNSHQPMTDQTISWGAMLTGRGKTFDLDQSTPFLSDAPVTKQYLTIQGRKILLEIVPLKNLQASLSRLPSQASIQRPEPLLASKTLPLPKTPGLAAKPSPMKLAAAKPSSQGYVLDYIFLTDTSPSDFIFQADTTYLVDSGVNLVGTTHFEGGTVIKYIGENSCIQMWGPVACEASAYCPIVMTSCMDDTVGEPMSIDGASVPFNNAFSPNTGGADVVLQHIRVSYADVGIHPYGCNFTLTDAQFVHCSRPICPEYATCEFNNILISDCTNAFWGGYYTVTASHMTIDGCQQFTDGWDDSSDDSITLTNCLLDGIVGYGYAPVTTNYTVTLPSSAGLFQTVGGGSYYLATDSPYRGAGTTNIDPGFLADIATKTTWPPIVYSNTDFAGGTYPPQAPRDTNGSPDLGYHYDPLDYVFSGANVSTNLLFPAGTAVGYFELPDSGDMGYGIGTPDSCTITYAGTLATPCVQAKYSTVQEGNGNWVNPDAPEGVFGGVAALGSASYDPPLDTTINAQFTLFATLATESGVGQAWTSDIIFRFTDCVINSGRANSWDVDICCTNCLFIGSWVGTYDYDSGSAAIYLQNCTMHEGLLFAGHFGGSTWPINIQNSAFENVDFSNLTNDPADADPDFCYYDYNAFVTNQSRLSVYGAHDVIVSSFNWQTSWLGDFYLPPDSSLINAGSITADQVGLYHFTTQTNQVPETNSIVDIGYHYVATDAYGNPLDSNGDGIPDYLEDANGNGLVDSGETDWALAILMQPVDQTVLLGSNATFTVTADGVAPLAYQWWFNATNLLVGATNATLMLSDVQLTNAGPYSVAVTNLLGGSLTSSPATLTELYLPMITTQPEGHVVFQGSNATLSVVATGAAPLNYQWQVNGMGVAGATNSTLTLSPVQLIEAGNYSVAVTNIYGATNSYLAPLRVWVPGTVMFDDSIPTVVVNLTNIVAVASGGLCGTNLALRADGTVLAWTVNLNSLILTWGPSGVFLETGSYSNVTNLTATILSGVPAGLSNVVAISEGYNGADGAPTFFALKSDGTVTAWGGGDVGDIFSTDSEYLGSNIVAVAANGESWVTLFNDGTTDASSYGNMVAVAANADYQSITLRNDGTIWTNGYSDDFEYYNSGEMPGLTNVIGIGAGDYFDMAILSNRTVVAWGDNSSGQCGVPAGLTNVMGVFAAAGGVGGAGGGPSSYTHSVALRPDGTLVSWGYGPPAVGSNWVAVAAGAFQEFVLSDWAIYGSPQIIVQPVSQTDCASSTVSLSVTATGGSITYQWQENGTNLTDGGDISGSTTATLTITDLSSSNAGNYRVILSNEAGTVISATATLAVAATCVTPTITGQPQSQGVCPGSTAMFTVAVSGPGPLSYQWQKNSVNLSNGGNVSGATSATLSLSSVSSSDVASYGVVVGNLAGSASSSTAALTLNSPPTITTQPQSTEANVGDTVQFTVVGSGFGPLTYQWFFNGQILSGATASTLTLSGVQAVQYGAYYVIVSNCAGSAVSSTVQLNAGFKVWITQPEVNADIP